MEVQNGLVWYKIIRIENEMSCRLVFRHNVIPRPSKALPNINDRLSSGRAAIGSIFFMRSITKHINRIARFSNNVYSISVTLFCYASSRYKIDWIVFPTQKRLMARKENSFWSLYLSSKVSYVSQFVACYSKEIPNDLGWERTEFVFVYS